MVESVTIDTSKENAGPTLEEQAAAQEAEANKKPDDSLPSDGETGDRPEWLPEKFKSPEDLAKAYSELESKLGQGSTEEGAQEAAEALDQAGLDYDAFAQEYAENGELSAEAYQALEEAGIPQHLVDQFIAGAEAQQVMLQNEVFEAVGGEEAYNDMISWAADALDDESIDAFNATLEGGSAAQIKLAIEGLRAQYVSTNGMEPSRTISGNRAANSVGAYESTAEMMRDMGDPRYMEDPAFRQRVQDKLARSNIL